MAPRPLPLKKRGGVGFTPSPSDGNPIRVQNVRQPDGTMYADTLEPSPDFPSNSFPVTYSAAPSGSWSQNSEYYWYSSLTGDNDSGIFNPNSIYDFGVSYVNPPIVGGQTDHIYIHLIDGQDGIDATNNYYMKFHKKYEDWVTDSTINHPLSLVNGQPVPSDWTYFQSVSNGYDVDETVAVTTKYSISKTESGTIGGQLITQSTDPEGFMAFQINEAITSTTQVTSSMSETISEPVRKTYNKKY